MSAGNARRLRYATSLLVLVGLSVVVATADSPESNEERAYDAEPIAPGSVAPSFDHDPPGYFICTLVTRYFDDETPADLQGELDLEARKLFVRFMAVGQHEDSRSLSTTVQGFQSVATWWEGDVLLGMYFIPLSGLGVIAPEASGTLGTNAGTPAERVDFSATEMLLEARSLRKQKRFDAAKEMLGTLRERHPTTAQARRALRELYLVRTAESRIPQHPREKP
jgi:hypothetical protein